MIFSFDILYKAWKNTVVQSSKEYNKARFNYYVVYNLITLLQELNDGQFKPRPLRERRICFPKERIAQVPAIRDKIVQHAICDEYLNHKLTKPLIKETSACLESRGTHYAAKILKGHLFNYYTHSGKHFYVLKCDIKSYFASIPHDRLCKVIDRYVDDESVKAIMLKFIGQLPIGLALGLQQSQLLANLYLSSLDHYCKENLQARYYGRYMDDFYIISHDYEYLQNCLQSIDKFLTQRLGLTLNPKTCICKDKIDYLGFTFFLTDTGKVLQIISRQKKHSKYRHIKKMLKQVKEGQLDVEEFITKYNGYRVHALQGNNYRLIAEWDSWIIEELKFMNHILIFDEKRWKLCPEH